MSATLIARPSAEELLARLRENNPKHRLARTRTGCAIGCWHDGAPPYRAEDWEE